MQSSLHWMQFFSVVASDSEGSRDLKDKIEELQEEISELKSNNEELEDTKKVFMMQIKLIMFTMSKIPSEITQLI